MGRAAPGLLECYGTCGARLQISSGYPEDMAPMQRLQPSALRTCCLKFREKIVAAKLLCCEYLRMSIRIISFRRPISIAGKGKKKKAFGHISPSWMTLQLSPSHRVWNRPISSLSGERPWHFCQYFSRIFVSKPHLNFQLLNTIHSVNKNWYIKLSNVLFTKTYS